MKKPLNTDTKPKGSWVQTERAAHEAWAQLIDDAPKAAKVMHILTAHIGENNAVVMSQETLAQLAKISRRTAQRALAVLQERNWIDIRQLGASGSVNAYIINDHVAWYGTRNGMRMSKFSATVILSASEQPDQDKLDSLPSLRRVPALYPSEQQLPSGDGLPPPSQPFLDGMEPDLPTTATAPREGVHGELDDA